jgi:transposase
MNQEKQKAKIYSAEFRESSVKLALDSDLPIAQTARDLGINPNTLHTWSINIASPRNKTKSCEPMIIFTMN